jgi:hypothetical protein
MTTTKPFAWLWDLDSAPTFAFLICVLVANWFVLLYLTVYHAHWRLAEQYLNDMVYRASTLQIPNRLLACSEQMVKGWTV